MKRTKSESLMTAAGIACSAVLLFSTSAIYAQNVTIRGKIAAVKGQELIVSSPNGDVKAALTEQTVVRSEQPIKFSDIVPGMYLGTTATKQSDGRFLASEVHVFSEDQRGVGEGHRPLGSAPESGATMTNANVERVEDVAVQNVKGRLITLKYKGGEVKVMVPPDVPVVNRVVTGRSALRTGAVVSVQGSRSSDGGLAAAQITIRATQK